MHFSDSGLHFIFFTSVDIKSTNLRKGLGCQKKEKCMTVHPSVTLLHSLILSGVEWEKSWIHCPLSPKGRGCPQLNWH